MRCRVTVQLPRSGMSASEARDCLVLLGSQASSSTDLVRRRYIHLTMEAESVEAALSQGLDRLQRVLGEAGVNEPVSRWKVQELPASRTGSRRVVIGSGAFGIAGGFGRGPGGAGVREPRRPVPPAPPAVVRRAQAD